MGFVDLKNKDSDFSPQKAIGVVLTYHGTHSGMMVPWSSAEDLRFFHLGIKEGIEMGPMDFSPAEGFLVYPDIPDERCEVIAAFCRRVWNHNSGHIPYGFSKPYQCFDFATGRFRASPARLGLTCSSFVIALFQGCGINLISWRGWPTGVKADLDAQEGLWHTLKISTKEKEDRRAQMGGPRVTPCELAAIVALGKYPCSFWSLYRRGGKYLEAFGYSAEFRAERSGGFILKIHWFFKSLLGELKGRNSSDCDDQCV